MNDIDPFVEQTMKDAALKCGQVVSGLVARHIDGEPLTPKQCHKELEDVCERCLQDLNREQLMDVAISFMVQSAKNTFKTYCETINNDPNANKN